MRQKSYSVRINTATLQLPSGVVDNEAVVRRVKENTDEADFLTPEWIEERVGIVTRRRFSPDEKLVDLSVAALDSALQIAGWTPADLDFIILASISTWLEEGGMAIPAMACLIQEQAGAFNAFAYDMLAACSGFTYGVAQAVSFIEGGLCDRGALICAENHDRGLNYADPTSCILIGDVTTATLLERAEEPQVHDMILLGNDARKLSHLIELPFGGYFGMKGRRVYREGVKSMCDVTQQIMDRNGYAVQEIDWFIFHQANELMLGSVGDLLRIPPERNLMNIREMANTTAGTIPSVLAQNLANGTIQRGDKIIFTSFGGGLTTGSILATY